MTDSDEFTIPWKEYITIPWKEFKDKFIVHLPSSYLEWLVENEDNDRIRKAAYDEWEKRRKYNGHIL